VGRGGKERADRRGGDAVITRRLDTLVDDYLSRLDTALDGIPARRRRQLVSEVGAHIEAARMDLPVESEAGIRAVLATIGAPEAMAAEELRFHPWSSRRPRARRLAAAIVALAVIVAGTVSAFWSSRDPKRPSSPATASVPDVVGLSPSSAEAALAAAHLRPLLVGSSHAGASGEVASERPAAGTTVTSGTKVVLRLSTGA
jgi:hypothetical protein